jgi:hypothetical protein
LRTITLLALLLLALATLLLAVVLVALSALALVKFSTAAFAVTLLVELLTVATLLLLTLSAHVALRRIGWRYRFAGALSRHWATTFRRCRLRIWGCLHRTGFLVAG